MESREGRSAEGRSAVYSPLYRLLDKSKEVGSSVHLLETCENGAKVSILLALVGGKNQLSLMLERPKSFCRLSGGEGRF
ncbi:MAG: hypothetical protein ACTS5P_02010 [Candidatus Hodgkinia cicadicola]